MALIAALRSEAACFSSARPLPGAPVRLDDRFTLVLAGMGAERAARAANRMILDGASAVISIGMAGALDVRVAPGDIILPEEIRDEGGNLEATDAWRRAVRERLAGERLKVHGGLLHSVNDVVDSEITKTDFRTATGATAVDMESGAIVRTAADHGIPALVLRVAVDPANMNLPPDILAQLDPYGEVRIIRLLGVIGANPAVIPALVRLARAHRAARSVLVRLARRRHEILAPDVIAHGT